MSKLLLDKNPSHCLDITVAVELSIITMNFIYVHSRDAQAPKNKSPQVLLLLNATTALCWAILKPLPAKSVGLYFKNLLLTRNILDEKNYKNECSL